MEQLTAIKAFPYAGKNLKPNDDFVAESKFARILVALGKAKRRVEDVPAPVVAKAKRTYKRKDLTAE